MEALTFALDSLAMIVMVFMGLRDDRRPAGTRAISIFRTIDDDPPPALGEAPRDQAALF